jgi:hypothetical protein
VKRISEFARAALLLLVLTGCSDLPVQPERREQELPGRASLVPQPGGMHCTLPDAKVSSGALYSVCVRPDKWNGDIVVFIPGYHDPADAPELPDNFSESPISWLFSELGYAFVTTSFRGTGLIEAGTWVGEDLVKVVETAKTLLVNTTGRPTRYVYQTGGSQGGLGTVQAIERYPHVFSGGLAACGPIGDYRRQIDYVADFRVVFDYFFATHQTPQRPPAIPDWPVWRSSPGSIDPTSWDMAQAKAAAALDDPSNADRIQQVLTVTQAPIDPSDPRSIKATTLGILWYSFRGTNDALAKLGGMAYGNLDRQYSGSADDAALNAGVERFQFTADTARLAASLQTSARPERPLVTMHTTGDPIVPVSHQSLYRSRLSFLRRFLHTPFTINRYGHCKFTDAEVLAAFAVLVLKVSGYDLLVSSTVLPTPQAQAEFVRLAREHGANPAVGR